MSPHDFSTGLCRGRDTLPLHPIPRNQTMAVYTEELTHLKTQVQRRHLGQPHPVTRFARPRKG